MNLLDAHCHLANLADVMNVNLLLDEAEANGITRFASSALRKCEVEWYLSHPDQRIAFSAGIHPNFDECDLELADIVRLCEQKQIWAIGEIGLDNGNPEIALQRKQFSQQLDLASDFRLPVVLHIVGHHSEAYDTLKKYPLKYLIHGYAGSREGYNQLKRLNAHFTISSRIMKEDKIDLLKAMLTDKRFLFETDITQYYIKEAEPNPLLRLNQLIETCSSSSGISVERLTAIQQQNAKALFKDFVL